MCYTTPKQIVIYKKAKTENCMESFFLTKKFET